MNGAAAPENPYRLDPFWRIRRLNPAKLQVHDVNLELRRQHSGPSLDIAEVAASSLVPEDPSLAWDKLRESDSLSQSSSAEHNVTETERQQLHRLDDGYGWMQWLRLDDHDDSKKVRWIHISSTFPEYIQGAFCGLTDWTSDYRAGIGGLRRIGHSIRTNERSSNHGRFFSPFLRPLSKRTDDPSAEAPFLMSMPFLDWTVSPGPPPPLRFQIDERETYQATKSNRHPMRSILQHHYRLEDTADRERAQVYAKHRPWLGDREIDLKVRRIYGHYPSSLAVDELWILVVDSRHIVTFSSNQSWKSRWPAMQLSARIADLSFLGFRKARHDANVYSTYLHAIVCVHGALGLVHRSFNEGFQLPCAERYASYMGHLQYRLYRAPSTKLVMDLLQLQDELAIILNISRAQEHLLIELDGIMNGPLSDGRRADRRRSVSQRDPSTSSRASVISLDTATPVTNVLEHLRVELDDLTELRTNTNELVNRTVQLVNIRLEDHGQAILVFTLVTVIFLPLSFLTSFFGMNVSDIRNMSTGQWIFWAVAAALTVTVVSASSFLAFYGTEMMEKFLTWKDTRSLKVDLRKRLAKPTSKPTASARVRSEGFTVLDVSQTEAAFGAGSW